MQAVACAEDVHSDAEIDDHGSKNAYPDQHVVGVDTQRVPVVCYPAPELIVSGVSNANCGELTLSTYTGAAIHQPLIRCTEL
jgi:hypothetical protein